MGNNNEVWILMPIILRAKHVEGLWNGLPKALRTPDAYRAAQEAFLTSQPMRNEVHAVDIEVKASIDAGVWRIPCRCGEWPHTDPEWGISCCFGCGARYTKIIFPEGWEKFEALLVLRLSPRTRNWVPSESYEDVVDEQVAHGDPVSAEDRIAAGLRKQIEVP